MCEENTNNSEEILYIIDDRVFDAATAPELKLYRPEISFFKAALYVLAHIFIGVFSAFIRELIKKADLEIWGVLSQGLLISLVLFLFTLRFSFIWLVRVYQRYAKSETRLRCCMTPSCSEYAILAFRKYGAVWGGIKTFKRLLRCHQPGGVDYP